MSSSLLYFSMLSFHLFFSISDSEGNKKKVKEVLNLSGEDRIVVDFDYLDSPFGEAQPFLSDFCGILAADSSLFPMHFERWPNMPISYFDRVFHQIIAMAETGQMPERA
ncbi:hypothetical protein RDI58_004188 [Solanum bulbocastanum]|uniref:DUF4325 domain-containing protein n=1 Tax=Solanum bulbocastanum TaxID=147425 RepID=A0AAN8U622_SOLBU